MRATLLAIVGSVLLAGCQQGNQDQNRAIGAERDRQGQSPGTGVQGAPGATPQSPGVGGPQTGHEGDAGMQPGQPGYGSPGMGSPGSMQGSGSDVNRGLGSDQGGQTGPRQGSSQQDQGQQGAGQSGQRGSGQQGAGQRGQDQPQNPPR